MLDEIFDFIGDIFGYIFSFEWLSDVWEFIGSMFENIGEFSVIGLVFGIISFGVVFALREYMLNPFLVSMGNVESLFWMVSTYLACFIAGYFMGKHFENT